MRTYVLALLLLMPSLAFGQYGGDKSNTTPASGGTAPSIVQACKHVTVFTSNPSSACTMSSNVTSGDKVYVVFYANAAGATPSIASTGTGCSGISWTGGSAVQTFSGTFASYYAYATVSGTGSCTITGTATGVTADLPIVAVETTNDNGFDVSWTWSAVGYQTDPLTPSISPSLDKDLILAGYQVNTGGTASVDSPFTIPTNGATTSPSNVMAGYQQTSHASIAAQFHSGAAGGQTNAFTLAIKHP